MPRRTETQHQPSGPPTGLLSKMQVHQRIKPGTHSTQGIRNESKERAAAIQPIDLKAYLFFASMVFLPKSSVVPFCSLVMHAVL